MKYSYLMNDYAYIDDLIWRLRLCQTLKLKYIQLDVLPIKKTCYQFSNKSSKCIYTIKKILYYYYYYYYYY